MAYWLGDCILVSRQQSKKRDHTYGVSVQVEDVIRINCADRRLNSGIEGLQVHMFWVSRLVHGIVTGDPCVVAVMLCNFNPQIDHLVLEELEIPEECLL